ncbi:hypothetical protein GT755_29560 [Herbidospora sp. NEAU-GS84]|uniref:Teneurin-like YD-shell domain-containing protein n=1 Tax=Herbidospora solisilvae TaxID=2696284 RepID=A0A7C9NRU8_9ACTN|nr:RHS repeat-associated core domain-containing protein [Herbidospora solisilvae]NAS25816.1 hypothetical protein [Herbidospora solisilvae]
MANGLTSSFGGGFTYVTSTAYSPTALLTERQYGSAGKVRRNYTWNTATGWLDRVTTTNKADTATPQNVHDDQFFYNTGGDITRVLDAASAVPGQTSGQSECFGYDGLHRLTSAYTTTGATCSTTFDGLGVDPYNQAWTYDPVGNITSVTNQGQNSTYTYPGAGPTATRPNALTSLTTPQGPNTYVYDNAGQLTARTVAGKDGTFSWNRLGQLEKATIDGDDTTMVYGADGERLIRRDPDGTATLYIGSMELSVSGGTVTGKRYYATSDGEMVAIRTTGTGLTWMLSGLHGSSQLAINDATSQVSRQRYLPYGQRRGADNLPGTDRGFLGKIEDDSTGLDYLSARYYDPTIGKFISTDPLLGSTTAPQSFNPYSYAVNNPIGNADPTGLCSPDYCPQRAGNLDRLADKTKDKKLKKKAAAVNKRDSKRYQQHYQQRDNNWVKRGKDPAAKRPIKRLSTNTRKRMRAQINVSTATVGMLSKTMTFWN